MALPDSNAEPNESLKPFDEQTDRRIHEHLSNEHDVISEDDIRNIKTSIEGSGPINGDPDAPTIKNIKGKKLKNDLDPELDNDSWGILDS